MNSSGTKFIPIYLSSLGPVWAETLNGEGVWVGAAPHLAVVKSKREALSSLAYVAPDKQLASLTRKWSGGQLDLFVEDDT